VPPPYHGRRDHWDEVANDERFVDGVLACHEEWKIAR
jgi:hypothetical protein